MKKNKKNKKKGSIIIEFLVVLPVFIFMAWAIMQIMFYVMVQSTIHQAAMDAARITVTELRGHIGPVSSAPASTQDIIKQKIATKVQHVTKYNAVLLLYRGENYEWLDPSAVPILLDPPGGCDSSLASNKRVICVQTDMRGASPLTGGVDEEMVVVKIKAKFRVIGSLLPSIENIDATGTGSAVKEQSERFQYINTP